MEECERGTRLGLSSGGEVKNNERRLDELAKDRTMPEDSNKASEGEKNTGW